MNYEMKKNSDFLVRAFQMSQYSDPLTIFLLVFSGSDVTKSQVYLYTKGKL